MSGIRASICTSVLNQSDLLKGMIESVIAQTFKDWELLIVDDGSTEDILSLCKSFNDLRVRYFRCDENLGVPHGSNFTMETAVGEYAQWLAADERIAPDKLELQIAYLDEHPGVDAVWGLPTYFAGNRIQDSSFGRRPDWEQYGLRAHNRSNEAWLRTLLNLEAVPLGSCSMLARRSVLRDLGRMDEKLKAFSDHELFCRFFSAGKVGVVLPYRWAVDVTHPDTVQSRANIAEELAYVRAKHPLKTPPVKGTITVGIPCFNHAKFLPACVESVLNQTQEVDEILILNDASTDNFTEVATRLVAKDSRIKIMAFPENMGCQEAKTQMAYRAEGDFFVVLSADDTLAPTFIERCMAEFEKNPWLEFVASQTDFIVEDGSPLQGEHPFLTIPKAVNRTREEWLEALRPGNHYFGAGIYRTRMISDIGGWKKEFKVIDDYEMYLKILQREPIAIVEEPLTHTRVHGKNQSMLSPEMGEELPKLYHEARKPYYRQLMKVVIATPFYELKGFSPYICSLIATMRLLTQFGIQWEFMELSGDSYVHRARNTICDRFLEDPEATDLFFIDSDMSWDPMGLVKMCLLPDAIVGGSYPVKHGENQWTSIPKMYEEEGAYYYKGRELGDGTALLQAQVLAGGFLRIKRHVLEQFRNKYPDDWYREPTTDPKRPEKRYTQFFAAEKLDGMFFGEDHYFSRKLRDMGMEMFIYPNVTISHFFTKPYTGNLDSFLKEQKKIGMVPPPAETLEFKAQAAQ
jgi:glycosyltransferase involved in cell wall biosynthesis